MRVYWKYLQTPLATELSGTEEAVDFDTMPILNDTNQFMFPIDTFEHLGKETFEREEAQWSEIKKRDFEAFYRSNNNKNSKK